MPRTLSELTKQRIAAAQHERWKDEDSRARTCASMKAANKAAWADPIKKAIRLEKLRQTKIKNGKWKLADHPPIVTPHLADTTDYLSQVMND